MSDLNTDLLVETIALVLGRKAGETALEAARRVCSERDQLKLDNNFLRAEMRPSEATAAAQALKKWIQSIVRNELE